MEDENKFDKKTLILDNLKSIFSTSIAKVILLFYLTFNIVTFSGTLAFSSISSIADFLSNYRIGSIDMLVFYVSLIFVSAIFSISTIFLFFTTLINYVFPNHSFKSSQEEISDEIVTKRERNLKRRFMIIIIYTVISILCSMILQISIHLYR